MDRDTLLELIPAYALDALDDDERVAVESLLESDSEAQSLLADYEAITGLLPFAAPMRPAPKHLQSDLRAKLAARQEDSHAAPVEKKKRGGTILMPQFAIGAVAAIVVVAIGLVFFLNRNPALPENEQLFNEIVAQANFQRFEVSPVTAADVKGELVVSEDGSNAVLRIAYLPQIEEDQRYQLWVTTQAEHLSGGLYYWPTGHGPYYLKIDVPLEELVRVGMTIEPEGGSPLGNEPTGPSLFGVQVAEARGD